MLKKILLITLGAFLVIVTSCKSSKDDTKDTIIKIETDLGNIELRLYNETPIHKENFIKNVNDGLYNGAIFHRVINEFMIQGGNPATAENDEQKSFDSEKTIPGEFIPEYYHKKGALAAARMPDAVNPDKESSAYQFYIVQGQVFSEKELSRMAKSMNDNKRKSIADKIIMERADSLLAQGIEPDFSKIYLNLKDSIDNEIREMEKFEFSEDQNETYTTIGGTPHLDGNYTVFGEVLEGLDIVEKIAAVKTDNADKPLEDIRMKVKILNN